MSEDNFEYYNNLQYDTKLKKVKGKFVVYIPELCMVASDEELNEAYRILEEAKANYFREILGNGLQSDIIIPENESSNELANALKPFFIKLAIITLLVVGISSYALIQVKHIYSNTSLNVNDRILDLKVAILENIINIADWPEADVLRRAERIKKSVKKIKPIADELKPLFHYDNQGCGDTSNPESTDN